MKLSTRSIFWTVVAAVFTVLSANMFMSLAPDARAMLAAAEAAVGDVFMVTFLTEKIGLELGQAVGVLREFRDWRTEKNIDAWVQP